MTICLRPSQAQAKKYLSIGRGDWHEIPSLTEELLAIDSCWKRESQMILMLLLMMISGVTLGILTTPQGRPNT